MKFAFLALVFFLIVPALSLAPDPPPYSQLDSRSYDPVLDPDIDQFIAHYDEGVPRQIFGNLIERDMLTKCDGDPLHPKLRRLTPEMAFKIPPDYITPHSNINVSTRDTKFVWFNYIGHPITRFNKCTQNLICDENPKLFKNWLG